MRLGVVLSQTCYRFKIDLLTVFFFEFSKYRGMKRIVSQLKNLCLSLYVLCTDVYLSNILVFSIFNDNGF